MMDSNGILPLPTAFAHDLEQFKGMARRRQLSGMMGGHMTRQLGQSLEFKDFGRYTMGDDIRHVDWRMSSRFNGGDMGAHDKWLLRRFHAEEQLKLTISIDTRDTMWLPVTLPKLQIALWVAEAISRVALESADKIVWHSLFGHAPTTTLTNDNLSKSVAAFAKRPESDTINLAQVIPQLPPTSVWVILTDFYFDHRAVTQLAEQVRRAQNSARWIMVIELDSWPLERRLLTMERTPVRIFDHGREKRIQADGALIDQTEAQIRAHTGRFRQMMGRSSYDHEQWAWPTDETVSPFAYFRDRFLAPDNRLLQLFMRSST